MFGAGRDLDARAWQSVARQLTAAGLLTVDHDSFGILKLDESARAVFRGTRRLELRKDRARTATELRSASHATDGLDASATSVFEALRRERARLAREQKIPAYLVFSDATLRAMAETRPADAGAMRAVPGVGLAKLERYGRLFLDVINGRTRSS